MKKKTKMILGYICNCLGAFFALYVGGWLMLIKPINTLVVAYSANAITMRMLIICIIKIALSTTVAGFVWCLGYIGYNYFKGIEDPDWRALEKKWKEKKNDSTNA